MVGALVGLVAGIVAIPLCRHLPRGISERLAQPPWTDRATRPWVLVAAGTAAGVAVAVGTRGDAVSLAIGCVLIAVLLPAAAIDVVWRVVPDTLLVLGAGGVLAVLFLLDPASVPVHLWSALGAGAGAVVLAVAARGGFGFGDVKLIALLGLALGPAVAAAIAVTGAVAALVALPLLVRRGRGATIPLVPFLAVGGLIVLTTDVL